MLHVEAGFGAGGEVCFSYQDLLEEVLVLEGELLYLCAESEDGSGPGLDCLLPLRNLYLFQLVLERLLAVPLIVSLQLLMPLLFFLVELLDLFLFFKSALSLFAIHALNFGLEERSNRLQMLLLEQTLFQVLMGVPKLFL